MFLISLSRIINLLFTVLYSSFFLLFYPYPDWAIVVQYIRPLPPPGKIGSAKRERPSSLLILIFKNRVKKNSHCAAFSLKIKIETNFKKANLANTLSTFHPQLFMVLTLN